MAHTNPRSQDALISSDPVYLLECLDNIDEELSDGDEFDGYLDPEDDFNNEDYADAAESSTHSAVASTSSGTVTAASCSSSSANTGEAPKNTSTAQTSSSNVQATGKGRSPNASTASTATRCTTRTRSTTCLSDHSNNNNIRPLHTFNATPGVVPSMSGRAPVDFFRLLFCDEVIDLILTESKRYADQYLAREVEHLTQHPHARAQDWKKAPLTRKELEAFISIVLTMGICGFPTVR